MTQNFKEIGARIKELREVSDYTQQEMAKALDIDLKTYMAYEDSGEDIPISIIYEIANMFKVDFTEIITGVAAKMQTYQIVRKGEGETVDRYPGYHYQDLAYKYNHKLMQPLVVTLDPTEEIPVPVTHKGQEFNLVLKGSIALMFEGKELILNQGDSIYFNSEYPHSQRCYGDKKAVFLTVITE